VAVDNSGALAGKKLTRITAGTYITCALDSQGAAYCWGLGGELGNGSTANSSVPTAVDTSGALSGKTLTQITTGAALTTCALDSAGAAYCWGYNAQGQLGDGTTTPSGVPVAVDTSGVLAGKTLTQIAAGQLHVGALDAAGAAYCWGYNDYGELGDNNASGNPSTVPVAVDTDGALAGKTLVQITAGWDHTCALDNTGAAYCWGENGPGELGDGTTTDSFVPVAVDTSGVLAGKTLTDIAAGGYHTCAVDSSGAAYCWGYDYLGELGDDHDSTQNDTDVPVLTGPQAPSGVTAVPGDTTVTVSWTAPTNLDGGTMTGYTATAAPGDAECTTTRGSSPASASRTRMRRRSGFARPYICLLIIVMRLTWPSTPPGL
jgi:alpha-tubulin suppressor-like RCC1 family protein